MNIEEHCHNYTQEIFPNTLYEGVVSSLRDLSFKVYNGCSRKLRSEIKNNLLKYGWSEKVEIDANTKINITSVNKEYGLCLQTGNMSRFYADLIKLEYLYKRGKVKGAFYILPSKTAADILGSNIVNFDRFTHELGVFKDVITIPIKVIGFR